MTEDEQNNQETPEEQEDTSQDADAVPAGPVDEDDSSSSQAAGEETTSPPPAGDADETSAEGSDGSEDEPAEAPDAGADDPDSDSAEEAEEDEAPEELAEDAATGQDAEAEEREAAEEPKAEKAEKKAEAIPGADLEPIAVEEEERPLSAEERARREAEQEERARKEAELVGDSEDEESQAATRAPAKLEGDARYLATGKRKRAIARVTLLPGSGEIVINRRPLEEFFPRPLHQTMARQPLATTGYEGSVDVRVRVHGGGIGGQAGAVRHGIARALTEVDPELRSELKRRGFLTRDARVKERRKAGLKKARKRPQFSKR
jgi:small subunit ribosomal protein S9